MLESEPKSYSRRPYALAAGAGRASNDFVFRHDGVDDCVSGEGHSLRSSSSFPPSLSIHVCASGSLWISLIRESGFSSGGEGKGKGDRRTFRCQESLLDWDVSLLRKSIEELTRYSETYALSFSSR